LGARGWRVSKNRLLLLMRALVPLAPQRLGHPHGDPVHIDRITIERPKGMFGRMRRVRQRARGLVLLRRDQSRE